MPDGDWMLYGLCCLSMWEWGPVMPSGLTEMASISVPPCGLALECNLLAHGTAGELKRKCQG